MLPQTVDRYAPVDGVLLSRPHQDRYGLLSEVAPCWPVDCGEAAGNLIRLAGDITRQPVTREPRPWRSTPLKLGAFAGAPML